MKYAGILFMICIFFGITVMPVFATFERNLKVGDRGEDVRSLQKFLNKNSATVVASSGPGSAGQETTYFGIRTAEAVARFQEQFREKVLDPLGLSKGTGIVGNLSRALLNKLYTDIPSVSNVSGTYNRWVNVDVVPEPPTITNKNGNTVMHSSKSFNSDDITMTDVPRSDTVKITKINPEGGSAGTTITITGSGFATSSLGNVVYVGGVRNTNVHSSDGKTIQVTVDTPFNKKPIAVADTLTDEDGNSVSVSGDSVTLSTKSYGTITFSPSSILSLLNRRSMGIPLAVYIEDSTGKISNEKIFTLNQ